MSALEVDAISVRYGDLCAIRDVSIAVATNEFVCIVGPNGAGKSTTLLTIAGVLRAFQGALRFGERDIAHLAPEEVARVGITLVPEGRHVFATLTVEENLRVGAGIRHRRSEAERDLRDLLDLFPVLRARLRGPAGKLSGGEQQQLVIARALMTGPKFLLVDEPSLGLAPRIVDDVYELLGRLRRERGLSLLIVEQSVTRALEVADRVYLLRDGNIRLAGTPAELRSRVNLTDAYFGF
jgi:branched-chain amino acid transport system ATP-binding protein